MQNQIFQQCQEIFPQWRPLAQADFSFDDPKGFSSFTMGIRTDKQVEPQAILYRRLEGKENAILDFETEKAVFLLLGENQIAAHCYYYDETCRIEAFYNGRTLTAADLFDPDNLRKIADQLYRFHQLTPPNLPDGTFFELLFAQWGQEARYVLEERVTDFPPNEQLLCAELREIYAPQTLEKVLRCLPKGTPVFCHNDTYHGNIMQFTNGDIKLLDFEFSCRNHKAFDFSNLFAETVMRHKLPDYPYFRIAEPEFTDREIGTLINFYLDNYEFESETDRKKEFQKLLQDTHDMLMLSDYMYAMAGLPLALEPIQKIPFIAYSHARFSKFLQAYEQRFVSSLNEF